MPAGLELVANGVDQMIGEHRDKEVGAYPAGCCIALGRRLQLRIQVRGKQLLLTVQQLLDALRQCRPLLLRYIEMSSEVHQGALTDALVGADRLDQAIGVIGLAAAPAFDGGASNVHAGIVAVPGSGVNASSDDYGTTPRPRKLIRLISQDLFFTKPYFSAKIEEK